MSQRHAETAERIIKMEGLAFALACLTQKELGTARAMLKDSICKALAEESERCAKIAALDPADEQRAHLHDAERIPDAPE